MTNDYSDRVSRAKENFTGPLNCAQAVAVTFQVLSGLTPEDIENHRHSGGGRAPGGLCGALYAALELLPDAGQRELVGQRPREPALADPEIGAIQLEPPGAGQRHGRLRGEVPGQQARRNRGEPGAGDKSAMD